MSPAGVALRRAGSADLDALVELWRELAAHHARLESAFALRADGGTALRRAVRRLLDDGDCAFWIAERGGEPLGFSAARLETGREPLAESGRGEIEDLYVRRGARRLGVGRALAEAALAWLAERGAARVEVSVAVRNAEGQAFWRALGFGEYVDVLQRHL
ncbi:MAG: GNAT family N-acetyltransferase [Myxococcota bacterium]|nr:GNAT family N-acetyltransferase [Myxococcota bacterium]